jgi:uncharacterized membrane protein
MTVAAKKSPLDHLLFVSRTFLVLAFLVNLVVAIIGYCILPEQVAIHYHRFGEINRCIESRDAFLLRLVAISIILFTIGFVNHSGFVPRRNRKRKANSHIKYWEQEENVDLGRKILDLWMNFAFSIPMIYVAASQFRFMLEHSASSPIQGNLISSDIYGNVYFDSAMITICIWLLLIVILLYRHLATVKRYRECRTHEET